MQVRCHLPLRDGDEPLHDVRDARDALAIPVDPFGGEDPSSQRPHSGVLFHRGLEEGFEESEVAGEGGGERSAHSGRIGARNNSRSRSR